MSAGNIQERAAVENIMRLASVLATARVCRFAARQPNYKSNETEAGTSAKVDRANTELRQAVEALTGKETP